ncbi:helix-turn-helix domain-containing protein [Shimia marina]|nr:helix-turn-helix transcriptional regulator [Shimia marina]
MQDPEGPTSLSSPPLELRKMFGRNLRELAAPYRSVASLCRDLGINRTQFNRYLSGDSFPRPDVLAQICAFFDVDARILLEPISSVLEKPGVYNHPYLYEFLGLRSRSLPEEIFPSGFYRFSRKSFIEPDQLLVGMIHVFRQDCYVFVRGFEPRSAMRAQGLPLQSQLREFRGVVSPQDDGVSFTVAHRSNAATTFNYLSRAATFHNSYWLGYTALPTRATMSGRRVTQVVYEHLNCPFADVMKAARQTGYTTVEGLPKFHANYLQLDKPFT